MRKRDIVIVVVGVLLAHTIIWMGKLVFGAKSVHDFLEAKGVFNR